MRRWIVLWLSSVVAAQAAPTPFSRAEPLALRAAKPNSLSVPCYGKFELTLDLAATFDNPFDPREVDVWAEFWGPTGQRWRVNGFLDQPHTRRLEGGRERIVPADEPVWRIRFTPDTPGPWRYRVFARDRTGTVHLPEAQFTATASGHPGFIRRGRGNPRGFAYDNGQPFFAVGENLCWGGPRGTFDYEEWLAALGQAGANWIRIWMCSWNCALEWSRQSRGEWRTGGYPGVGLYSLDNAWKLDTILDLAERHGVAVMLCLGTYGEFREGGYFGEGQWRANPYNATNGGPCLRPEDFWTHPEARRLYRQRLRYLAARYGWRPNLQAWEFWNEQRAPAQWVREMAQFLKGTGPFAGQPADPFGHLISTTYGEPAVWNLAEIDFTQSHHYGTGNEPDQAPIIHQDARDHARFGKPHLMAEFGIDWRGPDTKYDPEGRGVNLHNGLWASALSGNAGGAMIWWWDSYVHPNKLYGQFAALRKWADAIPWSAGPWEPLAVEVVKDQTAAQAGQATAESAGRLHLYGLRQGNTAILWAHNAAHHWKNVLDKKPVPPVRKAELVLHGLKPGSYRVEWWDTWTGQVMRRESATCADDQLRLRLADLATDVAVRVSPAEPR